MTPSIGWGRLGDSAYFSNWSIFYSISYSFPVYDFEFGDDDRPALLFMFLIIFSVLQLNFLKLKL